MSQTLRDIEASQTGSLAEAAPPDTTLSEGVTDEQSVAQMEHDAAMEKVRREHDAAWVLKARTAYVNSTTWLDTSMRKQWEKNVYHFQSKHAPGSKYSTDAYLKRSHAFRPKTRSGVRNNEAAFAAAMFSNMDLIRVWTANDDDQNWRATAVVAQALLQYRLTKTIPWFLTSLGAFQDAMVYGVACSYQYWKYIEVPIPVVDPTTGEESVIIETKADQPCIDLLPPENIRIDPAADWRDPINSSPYVIRLVPMYVGDVEAEMIARSDRPLGQRWRIYSKEQIMASRQQQYDSTRKAREAQRPDSTDAERGDNTTVWLHENFVRVNGREITYWTLGTSLLLSDPVGLEEVYFHGQRPLAMGFCVIEAHKTYPGGMVQLSETLQESGNDIHNQRMDNVQLVLNKRYFIRRGQQIDVQALMRNVPGGGVMMDDPNQDVRIVDTPDVTKSSYEEQERLDVLLDEMHGSVSQSTVQSNRQLNDTVGGMQLMNSGATSLTEYTIRTFVETWVEPVLRQLMLLEQYYESDETILALVGREAQLKKKFGIDKITDELLKREVNLSVNVGIGATNPQQRIERLKAGLEMVAPIPAAQERLDIDEVIKEVFAALGYKDGMRFFPKPEEGAQPDPTKIAQQAVAQAGLDIKQGEINIKQKELDVQMQTLDLHKTRAKIEIDLKRELQYAQLSQDREIAFAKLALTQNMTMEQLKNKLQINMTANETKKALGLLQNQTKRDAHALTETNRSREMNIKEQTGSGI